MNPSNDAGHQCQNNVNSKPVALFHDTADDNCAI